MRNFTPDKNAMTPANGDASPMTQVVLAFDDNRLASILFGQYGQNLALIERKLGIVADSRGNHVTVEGSRESCDQARRVLENLYNQIKGGAELVPGDVEGAIRNVISQGSLFDFDPAAARPTFEEINLRKRTVRARTAGQDAYIRTLKRNTLVFGTGPAGTGKTWLAVAHALALFERKEVDRIILSRPAVEAGERLGFLPGDMREKVDPYLRPIYDAMFDLMDMRMVERALQAGEIEIAPLAFALADATAADAADIARLHARSFRRGWSEDEIERLIAERSVLAQCARTGRKLAGFIMSRRAAGEAEILSVAVARERQGRGIAQRLLVSHLGRLMALGTRAVFLEVDEDNVPALRLYRRAGFREVGRRPGYYAGRDGKPANALVLRRDLT